MPNLKLVRWIAAPIAVAALLAPTACGDDDDGGSSENTEATSESTGFVGEGLAAAEVVVQAFDAGRLGSIDEVKADMSPFFVDADGEPEPLPITEGGKLLPLGELTEKQRFAFQRWHNESDLVNDAVGPEKDAAIQKYRESHNEK